MAISAHSTSGEGGVGRVVQGADVAVDDITDKTVDGLGETLTALQKAVNDVVNGLYKRGLVGGVNGALSGAQTFVNGAGTTVTDVASGVTAAVNELLARLGLN